MLPRSERTSVYIVVAVCVVAIIAGIIGLAQAMGGGTKAPPEYESRPSPKIYAPEEIQLANNQEASRPPISDGEFELFHRVARTVTPAMATASWRRALAPWVASPSVLDRTAPQVRQYLSYVEGKRISGARDIDVRRPTTVVLSKGGRRVAVERNGTSAAALITGQSLDGGQLAPSRLYVQYVWERRGSGQWRISSVEALYQPVDDSSKGAERSSLVGG